MKRQILLTAILVAGLFWTTGLVHGAPDEDTINLRKPVKVENLPEAVRETIQDEYENYRILEAWHVTGNGLTGWEDSGNEGTGQAGMDRGDAEQTGTRHGGQTGARQPGSLFTDNVDSWYELKLAKGQESKVIRLTEDGDELEIRSDNDKLTGM
jgi:hypothetical protein